MTMAYPSGYATYTNSVISKKMKKIEIDITEGNCRFITNNGTQCTKSVKKGKLCSQHDTSKKCKWFIMFCTLLTLLFNAKRIYTYASSKLAFSTKKLYDVKEDGRTLKAKIRLPNYKDSLIVVAGGTDTLLVNEEICKEYKLRSTNERCYLRIFTTDKGKIGIEAKIFSSNGDNVANISGNSLNAFDLTNYNYDNNGFELIDSKDNVCFNLHYVEEKNLLSVNGIFQDEEAFVKLYKMNQMGSPNPFSDSKLSWFNPDIDLLFSYATEEKGIRNDCSICYSFPFIRPTEIEKKWIKSHFGERDPNMTYSYMETPIILNADTIKGNTVLVLSDSLNFTFKQTERIKVKLEESFGEIYPLEIGYLTKLDLTDLPLDHNNYVPIKYSSLEYLCNNVGVNKNLIYLNYSNSKKPNMILCNCKKKFLIKAPNVFTEELFSENRILNTNDTYFMKGIAESYKIAVDTTVAPYNNIRMKNMSY